MAQVPAGESLDHLLQVLKTSQDFEERMKVLDHIGTASFSRALDQHHIAKALMACWEEEGTSIIWDCKWRTNISRIVCSVLPHSRTDIKALTLFIQLTTKATAWCGKCISEPESKFHGPAEDVLPQLLKETSALTLAIFAVTLECTYLLEKQFISSMAVLLSESFILVKIFCFSSTVRSDLEGGEIHKAGLDLLGTALRVISKVCLTIKSSLAISSKITAGGSLSDALQIVTSAMDSMQELGTLSARVEWGQLQIFNGKNIAVLNLVWKSCVLMLSQLENPLTIASVINIEGLITALVYHATQSLTLAAEIWLPQESCVATVSTSRDAHFRKFCILVKFFFSHISKLCSRYPKQATSVRKPILDCICKVSALLLVCNGGTLVPEAAATVLAEVAAPTALDFLPSLLGSSDIDISFKIEFLQTIITYSEAPKAIEYLHSGVGLLEKGKVLLYWDERFQGGGLLSASHVLVFLHLLQSSRNYVPNVLLELARRLDWLLETVSEEGVHLAFLQVQPLPASDRDSSVQSQWKLMFLWALEALETFATVASSSAEVWIEIEGFLFEKALHPSVLCSELVKDLWCFIARHSEIALIQQHIFSLFSLLLCLASPEPSQLQLFHRLARLICSLVEAAPSEAAFYLYKLAFQEDPFASLPSAKVAAVLFQEGFSFDLLQAGVRNSCSGNLLKHCVAAAKRELMECMDSDPVSTIEESMWCALHLLRLTEDGRVVDAKYMEEIKKLTLDALTAESQESRGGQNYSPHNINPVLQICCFFLQQKAAPKTLQILLIKIQELSTSATYNEAKVMKPALAEFLASLSKFNIPEDIGNPLSQALWDLFHLVLREEHWALVQAGLASFGYFAEHSPCAELWRFIPSHPGLAADVLGSGKSGEEMFMAAVKLFLEKNGAFTSLLMTESEKDLLRHECIMQRSSYVHSFLRECEDEEHLTENRPLVQELDSMKTDADVSVGLIIPPEVKTGLLMLQEGFCLLSKVAHDWLPSPNMKQKWQSNIEQLGEVNVNLGLLLKTG